MQQLPRQGTALSPSISAVCVCHLFLQVERISQYEARHAELLQQMPEEVQAHFRRRQVAAADSDGALCWTFPQLILDEQQFREEHAIGSSSEDSDGS